MDFKELYNRIRAIDTDTQTSEACGDPQMDMPTPGMEKADTPEPTMSVNMNAQGMDNIAGMMDLFRKVNPDMSVGDKPEMPMNPMAGMDAPMIKLPIDADGIDNEKPDMPDMDAGNDDMPGGEEDKEDEKEEAWDNEPDPEYDDMDAVTSGGDDLHKRKGAYPATAGGDNPRAIESDNKDLRGKIKEGLWAALQAKKEEMAEGRGKSKVMAGRGNSKVMAGRGRGKTEDIKTTEGRGKGKGRGRGKG